MTPLSMSAAMLPTIALYSTGTIWGSVSGVLALVLASLAFCAWLYVTLRHRAEKQLLVYGVITRLQTSDITCDSLSVSQPGQIKASPGSAKPSDVVLTDQVPNDKMKHVARDLMKWCLLRWGGPFGARAGSDSTGTKLGIWNDRFEGVRCAVMLLAFRKVNAAMVLENQKAMTGTNKPGQLAHTQSTALIQAFIFTIVTVINSGSVQ